MWSVAGYTGSGVSLIVQPPPVSSWGHPAWAIKHSEMAATCAGLGDSQVKPN